MGRRTMAAYSLTFAVIALGLIAVSVYLVLAAALGWKGPWVILWLFPTVPLLLYVGSIGYADIYRRSTGRRPPMRTFQRVIDRLMSDVQRRSGVTNERWPTPRPSPWVVATPIHGFRLFKLVAP